MTDLAAKFKIPAEIMAFVNDGFLEVAEKNPARATVEFRMPLLGSANAGGRYELYYLVWIHPARNGEFCDYYFEKPGDMPNFYVRIDRDHSRDQQVEGLDTVDGLVDWLTSQMQEAKA